jgi:hypothetical protein
MKSYRFRVLTLIGLFEGQLDGNMLRIPLKVTI